MENLTCGLNAPLYSSQARDPIGVRLFFLEGKFHGYVFIVLLNAILDTSNPAQRLRVGELRQVMDDLGEQKVNQLIAEVVENYLKRAMHMVSSSFPCRSSIARVLVQVQSDVLDRLRLEADGVDSSSSLNATLALSDRRIRATVGSVLKVGGKSRAKGKPKRSALRIG